MANWGMEKYTSIEDIYIFITGRGMCEVYQERKIQDVNLNRKTIF